MKKVAFLSLFLFCSTCLVFASQESEAKLESAMSLYKQREMQKAISVAKEAITLDPKISNYYVFIGNIYEYLKQYDEGERYFNQALKINPKDPGALNGLGEVYASRGLTNKAIKMYEKAIKFAPDYYGVYVNVGMEYIKLYQEKNATRSLFYAKENLEKAIALNNKAYDAYFYLGKVYLNLHDYENAIKNLEKSISINRDPNSYYGDLGGTYYDLGSAYYNLGRYKEAINAFQESLKIKPNASDAIFALGASYLYSGDKEKAEEKLEELEHLDLDKALVLKKAIERQR